MLPRGSPARGPVARQMWRLFSVQLHHSPRFALFSFRSLVSRKHVAFWGASGLGLGLQEKQALPWRLVLFALVVALTALAGVEVEFASLAACDASFVEAPWETGDQRTSRRRDSSRGSALATSQRATQRHHMSLDFAPKITGLGAVRLDSSLRCCAGAPQSWFLKNLAAPACVSLYALFGLANTHGKSRTGAAGLASRDRLLIVRRRNQSRGQRIEEIACARIRRLRFGCQRCDSARKIAARLRVCSLSVSLGADDRRRFAQRAL